MKDSRGMCGLGVWPGNGGYMYLGKRLTMGAKFQVRRLPCYGISYTLLLNDQTPQQSLQCEKMSDFSLEYFY